MGPVTVVANFMWYLSRAAPGHLMSLGDSLLERKSVTKESTLRDGKRHNGVPGSSHA